MQQHLQITPNCWRTLHSTYCADGLWCNWLAFSTICCSTLGAPRCILVVLMLVEVSCSTSMDNIYLIWLSAFLPEFTVVQVRRQSAHPHIQYWFGLHSLCSCLPHIHIHFPKCCQILLHPLYGAVLHSFLPILMLMCSWSWWITGLLCSCISIILTWPSLITVQVSGTGYVAHSQLLIDQFLDGLVGFSCTMWVLNILMIAIAYECNHADITSGKLKST